LYDPDEGRILLDGVDLRDYDLGSLRTNIGVIFQDFVRYDFVMKEHIGVSQIERLEDEARIREAARRSLADSVAGRPEHGYDQMLGRRSDGAVDLAGGGVPLTVTSGRRQGRCSTTPLLRARFRRSAA